MRRPLQTAIVLLAAGCSPFVRPDGRNFDLTNLPPAHPDTGSSAVVASAPAPPRGPEPAADEPTAPRGAATATRLDIPPDLPGAASPPLDMPRLSGLTPDEKVRVIKDKFPALRPLAPEPIPEASPTGKPLTLAELEQMALASNPLIRQAAADVEQARGQVIQVGLMPNPEIGFQTDQLNSGVGFNSRGQNGGYVSWMLKTAGKLRLARLVETMNYLNAEVALRKAQIDLTTQVRRNYFGVLVAEQGVVITRALAQLSDEIYVAELRLLQSGNRAGYEPLQSYVLAVQARGNLVQARNRYLSAWRQLAASLNRPDMPPTQIAGRGDAAAPFYDFDQLRETMLANHTDLATAQNAILRERYQLQLAKVTPIPDIKYYMYIERDWSTPPFNTQVGIQAGGAIPVFDRNQGNRLTAQAALARAIQEVPRVTNDLSAQLADGWENYANNKVLVEFYLNQAIPNQVRVYRGTFERFRLDAANLNYNDVVLAQQTLATILNSYLAFLTAQWEAVVDLANLTQQPELYPGGVAPEPNTPLEKMLVPSGPQGPGPDAAPAPDTVLPEPNPGPPDGKP